ncbi:DUF11 domain-containing protein [Candidatus Saccharibacteria bacterium]|nr:DUF11 domain-containing protein [Candidatus Saccharibacteria bacterium]
MKKQAKHTILKMAITGAVVAVAFMPAYQALAWGPERETFRWADAAPFRTMNSIIDNPSMGDERNFVRVRKVGDPKFVDEVTLQVGQEYEVEIYFHNNASRTLNASGAGIADGVRVSSILPSFVAKGTTGEISATITAANTRPASVWDEAFVRATSDVYLRFVPDSAIIHSNGTVNGKDVGQQHLFSSEGANIGYWDDAWGVLPGCNEYAGYISYRFVVDQPRFEIAKDVSRDAKNEWVESITVGPDEILDFRIRYKNTGTTEQSNVIVTDQLPNKLRYLTGTTFLINGSSPSGKFVADDLFGGGLNIGRYQAGSEATLTYKVKTPLAEDLQCGNNKFVNGVSVSTPNGTMTDDVEVNVVKNCTPTELPETGPGEIALAVIAVLCVGVGGTYWYRSRKMLKSVKNDVGGSSGA